MNYFDKMLEAADKMRPGTFNHIIILHDEWCDLVKGLGPCNCDPEVGEPIDHDTWTQRN